jgi:hypothetical protein
MRKYAAERGGGGGGQESAREVGARRGKRKREAYTVEVLLVRLELVQPFQIVVAPDHLERGLEAVQVVPCQLQARARPRKQLLGLLRSDALTLSQVAQAHDVGVGFRVPFLVQDDLLEMLTAHDVVLHVAGVQVQVAEDRNRVRAVPVIVAGRLLQGRCHAATGRGGQEQPVLVVSETQRAAHTNGVGQQQPRVHASHYFALQISLVTFWKGGG